MNEAFSGLSDSLLTNVASGGQPDFGQALAPEMPDLGPAVSSAEIAAAAGRPTAHRDISLLADIPVEVAVEIGRLRMPLRDLLSLEPGAVLELDRAADAPVDVLVNGRLVARGEVVVIDGEFGVRVTDLVERSAESPRTEG